MWSTIKKEMYRVATKSRTTNRSLQKVHDFEKFPWNFSSSAAATRFLSRFSVFHIYVAQSSPLVFTLHPISLHDLCDSHPRLLCDVLVFVLLRWCIIQITKSLNCCYEPFSLVVRKIHPPCFACCTEMLNFAQAIRKAFLGKDFICREAPHCCLGR